MKVIRNHTLTLNFVKKKIVDILKTYWSTKPSKFLFLFIFKFKKSLHVLEDGASDVRVGDIEQVIV